MSMPVKGMTIAQLKEEHKAILRKFVFLRERHTELANEIHARELQERMDGEVEGMTEAEIDALSNSAKRIKARREQARLEAERAKGTS
jgi:hypothetical protein